MSDPVEEFLNKVAARERHAEDVRYEQQTSDDPKESVVSDPEVKAHELKMNEMLSRAGGVMPEQPALKPVQEPQLGRCGHEQPNPAAKFCFECGAPLNSGAPVGSPLAVEKAARVDSFRPKPEELLTEEEKAERRRQHQAAVAAGKRDVPLEWETAPEGAETFLIHFLEDGFGAFGNVWYRGQELEVIVGSERWEEGWNRGTKWLRWQDAEQMHICGKVYFRRGPWPGRKSYADGAGAFERLKGPGDSEVTGPSVEQLLQADKIEARRRRGVPRPARV